MIQISKTPALSLKQIDCSIFYFRNAITFLKEYHRYEVHSIFM